MPCEGMFDTECEHEAHIQLSYTFLILHVHRRNLNFHFVILYLHKPVYYIRPTINTVIKITVLFVIMQTCG